MYCKNDQKRAEMDANALYEMYNLFEDCRKEMFRLMTHINDRFTKTMEFQKFQESQ